MNQLGQLGDVVCLGADCDRASYEVALMLKVFNAIKDQAGDPTSYEFVQRFSAPVYALNAQVKEILDDVWWGLFNQKCCAANDLADQAATLVASMTDWARTAGINAKLSRGPGLTEWWNHLSSLGKTATATLSALVVVAGGVGVFYVVQSVRRRSYRQRFRS